MDQTDFDRPATSVLDGDPTSPLDRALIIHRESFPHAANHRRVSLILKRAGWLSKIERKELDDPATTPDRLMELRAKSLPGLSDGESAELEACRRAMEDWWAASPWAVERAARGAGLAGKVEELRGRLDEMRDRTDGRTNTGD